MEAIDIAKICHEANKILCITQGDMTQSSWDESPEWQKNSILDGVLFHLSFPDVKPSSSHYRWLELKIIEGWKYGKVKNIDKKEHPCLVPFDELSKEHQAKDHLFKGIVDSLRHMYNNKLKTN